MTIWNRLSLLLTATLLAGALMASLSFAQSAEQRLQKLEEDVEGINRKFDTLLELMQQQTPSAATPTSGSAPSPDPLAAIPSAAPETIRMGQLHLDVFALPAIKDALPAEWGELPVASGYADGTDFRFGAFRSLEASKHLEGHRDGVMLRWSGYIQITNSGSHTFVVTGKNGGGNYGGDCKTSLRIKDTDAANTELKFNGNTTTWMDQGTLLLEPGFYEFRLSLVCRDNDRWQWDQISITVAMAAPGERTASPIPASLFGIAE